MDFKNRLILFFILIAVIPIATLSAVSTITIIKFKDHATSVHDGFVANMEILTANKGDLLGIRSDLIQYSSAADAAQKSASISHALALKNNIDATVGQYKTVEELPGEFLPVEGQDLSRVSADETVLVQEIEQEWQSYGSQVEDLAILSTDSSFSLQADSEARRLVAASDGLVASYDELIAVNGQIGDASRAQSQEVMRLAFFYGSLAASISAAAATAAAILVSKRVVLGDLVRMSKMELVETTLRDLIGGGADALVEMIKSQMQEGKPRPAADIPSAVVSSESEDVIIGKKKSKAFIEEDDPAASTGRPAWVFAEDKPKPEAKAGAFKEEEEEEPAPKGDYRGKLVILNTSKFGPAAKALDDLLAGNGTVVLTRRGSNVYRRAKGKTALCVLAQSAGPEGRNGERVIPTDNEDRMAKEIESIIKENPELTVVIDSATELIYTLGFEKAFSLLRRVSEAVSSYEGAGAVVLMNKKAHEPRMVEAIANISNESID
ncbi:hypothetical protein [Candidatus Nitrososphaera sp. FF02]|uniref:hypothetical protein n=1 Tax=Candidatus Nitrososphaera sp. FF02 TaxID=3398226 RepID=UPI0039E8BEEF